MWDIVTSILYIECGLVSLLVLPIVTLNQWTQIIHSNLMKTATRVLKPWIYVYVCLLTFSIVNSLRIMHQSAETDIYKDEEKLLQFNLRQAMAQRNFYISSTSVFLMALTRRLLLMKMTQAEEVEDFLNIGVEYNPGRREPEEADTDDTTSIHQHHWHDDEQLRKDITIEPVAIDDLKLTDKNVSDYRNWSDIEEWSSRMRRITANLVHEEKNNEALKTCAKHLSNFCMRLDEDYRQIQSILGSGSAAGEVHTRGERLEKN